MKVSVFFPPVKNITGGMQVLLQVAGQIKALGHGVRFYLWENGHEALLRGRGFDVTVGKNAGLEPGEVFLVPEGWPNVLHMGINSSARCVVYCQNWAYLFSALPEGVYWRDLPVEFVAVSQPVAVFIENVLAVKPMIVRPCINDSVFFPASKPDDVINIAYMPRKNRALYKQIRHIFESRNRGRFNVKWKGIDGLELEKVADNLRKSHIFLATGFPEGCPLPPLEAMACRCMVVGFAGFGGWDYMRQSDDGYTPQIPLRMVQWQGNGYFSADGDVLDAALNLEKAVSRLSAGDESLGLILENSLACASHYSNQSQQDEVLAWINSLQ